jgi:hypothetical protein
MNVAKISPEQMCNRLNLFKIQDFSPDFPPDFYVTDALFSGFR